MPRLAQLVMGPAGSGKSTYCNSVQRHCEMLRRTVHVVNLDPAAEQFQYNVLLDIRDLISIDDVMDDEELRFGPNGGLIFCMEHLAQNLEWLKESLDDYDDDYVIFDCPGQIELYSHLTVMEKIVDCLKSMGFEVCGVFVMDAQFLVDAAKLVSGFMVALSNMVVLELPHINIVNKIDLLSSKKQLYNLLEKSMTEIVEEHLDGDEILGKRYKKLNHAIAGIVDDYSLVRFLPLERDNEGLLQDILTHVEMALSSGDDQEHFEPREFQENDNEEEGNTNVGVVGPGL